MKLEIGLVLQIEGSDLIWIMHDVFFSSEQVRHEGVVDDIARRLVGAAAVRRDEHLVH
jgi:hypothetical protein